MERKTSPFSLNCRGRLLRLDQPCVMGILNVTPDSFYDGGKFTEESAIRKKVAQFHHEGAMIIDIGGASSRPGSAFPSIEEEMARVIPAIYMVRREFPDLFISVDTWRKEVAEESLKEGAHMINDISAGLLDTRLPGLVAEKRCPYLIMHMQGTPETMQDNPVYDDVTATVYTFFCGRLNLMRKLGIQDIVIDPGFGFGKTIEHNFSLLRNLHVFKNLGVPLLAGLSRKSMINKTLHIKAAEALNGTSVLNTIALQKGTTILRVHDARQAMECIALVNALNKAV